MTRYRLESGCPHCGRTPNVQFSEEQVQSSQRDRAAGLHSEIQCPRCSHRWWIRNRDVASAELAPEPKKKRSKKKAKGGST